MNPEQFARFRKTPKFNEKLYNIGRVAEAEVAKERAEQSGVHPIPSSGLDGA